jgi:segregation and condensation protein B
VGPEPVTEAEIKSIIRTSIEELVADYNDPEHGIEIRQIAGGYRMATKPEQHDLVRGFAKSLKPPVRFSLQSLETLAVIAYKQPITAPEISEIRGVDAGGVLGTLLDRKLIATAGRKQVIGRPILYKTTKEFLLRFGLKDLNELPSMEEFEKLATESFGGDLFTPQPQAQVAAPSAAETPAVAQEAPETIAVVQETLATAGEAEAIPAVTADSEESS